MEASLLEERTSDAKTLVEEALKLTKSKGAKVDEVRILRASILVKLVEGKPLDALEIATKAEKLLLETEGPAHQEAGELLLLVAKAHLSQGTSIAQEAALNAALQAVDHMSKAEDGRGEADAWRVVLDARVALRRFEDGLRAAEAAMVICLDCGDETGQALCLLSLAKAHKLRGLPLKAKKASEKALNLFQEQSSDMLAAEALHILVEALIGQEQRKEALQRAKQELFAFLGSGDKWAVPSMRLCLVKALMGMDRKKEALSEAEKALEAAEELTKSSKSLIKVHALKQVAICNMLTGKVDKAKELADQILPMCRLLGDVEGEDSMNELLGIVIQQRGALEEHAAKEREAEDLILQLKEAMLARDGKNFKAVLEKCYENENVFTENVEEMISPVIATDPDGLFDFFLQNQPEKWKVNPEEEESKFDSAQQFDRRLMYYAFRVGAMGYGPGFRLIKTNYRLGQNFEKTQGFGTLDLMDNCPDWEENARFHPGILDCVLQVGAVRGVSNEYQYSGAIK